MHSFKTFLFFTVIFIITTTTSFGWGNATHMYYVKHLNLKHGQTNLNEMYGSVLPDAFNFMFDANGKYLYLQTHENFEKIFTLAWNHQLKQVAYGDISHNQLFGADWTAHLDGFTTTGGYAVEKGIALAPLLVPTIITILTDAGLDQTTAEAIANGIAPELGHDLSETAVDILVKRNLDRSIGKQILLAAQTRNPDVPHLLSLAYNKGLAEFAGISTNDASKIIMSSEKEFRKYIMQYGKVFMLPESQTITLLAMQTAPIAKMYLEAATGNAVTVTVTPEQVSNFISAAISIVQSDYAEELSQTLHHLEKVMKSYNVGPFACLHKHETSIAESNETTPLEFSLNQNYPNPFNPNTSISYTLPASSHVTLKIYNVTGQEVATLVNENQSEGVHIQNWDATELPSGLYIYRFNADGYTLSKQMMLIK